MQFNKVNNIKEQYRSADIFKGGSGQQCVTWAHAHVFPKSHGCTCWRSCRSLFFPLLVLVTGAWTPGVGAHVLVAGIASLVSATRSRGWMVGFQWKPLESIF